MHIRLYQTKDLDETVALWWDTRRSAFTYIQEQYTFDEFKSHFRDVVAVRHQVWVAELENCIIGFIAINESFIGHLYVAHSCQRQGIGTILLNLAKKQSPHNLSLYTFQKNTPARTFYEKHGFQAVKFGFSPDEGEPDVLYEWKPPKGVKSALLVD